MSLMVYIAFQSDRLVIDFLVLLPEVGAFYGGRLLINCGTSGRVKAFGCFVYCRQIHSRNVDVAEEIAIYRSPSTIPYIILKIVVLLITNSIGNMFVSQSFNPNVVQTHIHS